MIVAVLGGGQLGRMLALSGYPLGLRFRFLDPAADAPAGQVGPLIVGAYDDPAALARLVGEGDDRAAAVTYEFENVPAGAAAWLQEHAPPPVYPPANALAVAQDRVLEKELFRRLGIPTPRFAAVSSAAELEDGLTTVGLPAVLKTRRFGYDGKGQRVIRTREEAREAFAALGKAEGGLIVEELIPFEREVSVLGVRRRVTGNETDEETVFYPLAENTHRGGILRVSRVPAPDQGGLLHAAAERYAGMVLSELDYVGVLAIEFFVRDGVLLANEMAPRVHNSGHWTIEGAVTSQFENHVRAVLGLSLGSTALTSASCMMVNVIGDLPQLAQLTHVPNLHIHMYGKSGREGRKVGHLTICSASEAETLRTLERVQRILDGA